MKNAYLLICIILGLSSQAVKAESLYYGFRFGYSQFDSGLGNPQGTARLEENDFGYKLFAGLPINNSFSMEAFFIDYGEATLGGHAGDAYTFNGSDFNFQYNDSEVAAGLQSIGVNGIYHYALSQTQSLFLRLGIQHWEYSLDSSSPFQQNNLSKDDWDLYWNLGFEQKLGEALSLQFDIESLQTAPADVNSLALSLLVQF